jgi:quercetin dioxygenase-like cupin family protein
MSKPPSHPPVLVPCGPKPIVRAFDEEVEFLLTGAQTDGKLCQWIETTPPGVGPPPHWHENDDEWFHVLEGRVSFLTEGTWNEVGPGATAFVPKGAVHAFENVGDTPSRMLISTSPAGFETFFTRCAAEFAQPGGPDMQRVNEIAGEHGIHFAV